MPKVSASHLAARREQIIEAAKALFAERGFSRTTMADVVAASGLSTGAVYHYFPSKAELVLAAVAGRDGTVDGQFIEETPGELIARLAGYVAPGDGAAHARFIAQVWGDAAVTPELAAVARSAHQRLEEHLSGLLAGQQAEHGSSAAEAAATARVALASMIGLSALVASDVPVDTASFVRVVTRLLDP
jgi:TetR/AcrR family transcriptional regulator, transcriptional repressor of aconitase